MNSTADMARTAGKRDRWLGYVQIGATGRQGAFPGSRYCASEQFRPSDNSMMNSLFGDNANTSFNAVSREKMIMDIWRVVRPIDGVKAHSPHPPSRRLRRRRWPPKIAPIVPPDFYSTNFYTDRLLAYLRAHEGDGRPFFAFAAYTATHAPLQAPDDFIERYRGVYDVGYEEIRRRRIARQKELGIYQPTFSRALCCHRRSPRPAGARSRPS